MRSCRLVQRALVHPLRGGLLVGRQHLQPQRLLLLAVGQSVDQLHERVLPHRCRLRVGYRVPQI